MAAAYIRGGQHDPRSGPPLLQASADTGRGGADPERTPHRAFGLPLVEVTTEKTDWPRKVAVSDLSSVRINPTGELPTPEPVLSVVNALNENDGFQPTEVDQQTAAAGAQLVGQFLSDTDGLVRWTLSVIVMIRETGWPGKDVPLV